MLAQTGKMSVAGEVVGMAEALERLGERTRLRSWSNFELIPQSKLLLPQDFATIPGGW